MVMNYYVILWIKPAGTYREIKDTYRRQAQTYYPDHYGEDSSHFLRIQEAYRILSDPVMRQKYDKKYLKTVINISNADTFFSGRYSQKPELLRPSAKSV